MSRPGSPTDANHLEAIETTENIIDEMQLLRKKLSRRSHKRYMRWLLNQASELLQSKDITLKALAKLKQQIKEKQEDLSTKNEEIEEITLLQKLEEEIEETITFTEEIDVCPFELEQMVKRLSAAKDESTQQRRYLDGNGNLRQTNKRLPKL